MYNKALQPQIKCWLLGKKKNICIYIYMCIYIFRFFFFIGYYKTLNIFSCAVEYDLVVYFIYSVYLLIPNSLFIYLFIFIEHPHPLKWYNNVTNLVPIMRTQ